MMMNYKDKSIDTFDQIIYISKITDHIAIVKNLYWLIEDASANKNKAMSNCPRPSGKESQSSGIQIVYITMGIDVNSLERLVAA